MEYNYFHEVKQTRACDIKIQLAANDSDSQIQI